MTCNFCGSDDNYGDDTHCWLCGTPLKQPAVYKVAKAALWVLLVASVIGLIYIAYGIPQ